jgi:segregation and condensation protein A
VSFKVQLDIFEGPLDLLLHLIKKNEVTITEIPIATITEQYLATLELMQSLNLNVAGEFLVMAATLVHLKSKTLLPPEEGEPEEEEEDSAEGLVRQLLEYQRFKEAAESLQSREILRRDVFTRKPETPIEEGAVELETLSIFDLLSALRKVLAELPKGGMHQVVLETISVRDKMSFILDLLHRQGETSFQSLFESAGSRLEVVVMFLAMLELVKMRAIRIRQEAHAEPIVLELAAPLEEIESRLPGDDELEGESGGA